jgi:hypothetical protein
MSGVGADYSAVTSRNKEKIFLSTNLLYVIPANGQT